jgi:hypothetical protein
MILDENSDFDFGCDSVGNHRLVLAIFTAAGSPFF